MDGIIRYSRYWDKIEIENLIEDSFGSRGCFGVMENISGRYLVYELNGNIVAMTGLTSDTVYKDGLEIDWTCTAEEHRGKGIMRMLFKKLLKDVEDRVYCSCWKIRDNKAPNLKSIMDEFGFKCILEPRVKYDYRYNCPVEYCSEYSLECYCSEDLYVRN